MLIRKIAKNPVRGFLYPLCLIFVLCMQTLPLFAQSFQYTENCRNAYQAFMSMKVNEGKMLLLKEITSNKTNFLPLILFNYDDFITLTFNEDPAEYKKRKPLFEKRISILQYADQNSPYYLFSKALLYFQWSAIRIKYTDYWDAAWDFRKAFLLFKENRKKFPNFPYNDIYIGTQEALISTIPSGYKWISNILGMKGNMKSGMSMLKKYIQSANPQFKEEAYLYYIYLKNYLENDIEGASQLIYDNRLDIKNNHLFTFMAANLALNNKKAALAESILVNRNRSADYLPFPMLEYELGDAKMKRLDYSAIGHFENFMKTSKSNFYIKDACYSIALCYHLQNKSELALKFKLKIKSVGKTESDADKQAQKFAQNGVFPNREILKARLLNDGGNNDQALQVLLNLEETSLSSTADKLEYYYRFGRVYDELKQDEKAIFYYNKTIEAGNKSTEYFAARAALQAGYIFEKSGNKNEALRYFNIVLNLENHEFKNSLDQRAKASINRIKGI